MREAGGKRIVGQCITEWFLSYIFHAILQKVFEYLVVFHICSNWEPTTCALLIFLRGRLLGNRDLRHEHSMQSYEMSYGIIAWLRLEGTLKIIELESPCHELIVLHQLLSSHPAWPWAPPGKEHPQLSGQQCQGLWVKNFPLPSNLDFPF